MVLQVNAWFLSCDIGRQSSDSESMAGSKANVPAAIERPSDGHQDKSQHNRPGITQIWHPTACIVVKGLVVWYGMRWLVDASA